MTAAWSSVALALFLSAPGAQGSSQTALEPSIGDKEPPKVVSLEPENGGVDLDAKKITKLVVVFDRPMNDSGYSLCGGGPQYPQPKSTRWDSPTKLVAEVALEPDHDYQLSLNCPVAMNFRSKEGVSLAPLLWSFSTAPEKLPDPARQKAENKKALEALSKLLPESYSYYDLRVKSWDKLFKEHESAIVGAKTTRGWARAVAKMLAAAEDLHMYLKLGEQRFGTGSRAVDALFRKENVTKYVSVQPMGDRGLQGRTPEGIGYVMIPAWESAKEVDAVEAALATMRDCKAIVVDVRPNSGGDELLAQRIAAWFVDGTKTYARNRYRERAGKNGFGPVLDRTITGNQEDGKRLRAPVAVLTSRYVMSSNEAFVLMMEQAGDCTTVGQRTYGSSGNPKPHDLPNGVTILVPSWQALKPDGTCFESEGIAPDVEVAVDAKGIGSADPILDKALSVLRGKIK
jgi:hypothetical protein